MWRASPLHASCGLAILLACALPSYGIAQVAAAHPLVLVTEEYPPFNMSDAKTGALHGIAVEKVQEMMRRAQEKYTLNILPWTRAYQMGLQLEDTCVFSTTRTPEREPLFKWIGPLVNNPWMVFGRADDTRHPKKLEDLRPYVLGGYQTDAVGEFLKAQGFKVDLAVSDADNPKKLLHKRFDFWATGELLGKWLIKNGDYSGKIIPLFTFRHTEMYLACNIKMPAARVEKFNHILRDMAQDGVVEVIEQRYR